MNVGRCILGRDPGHDVHLPLKSDSHCQNVQEQLTQQRLRNRTSKSEAEQLSVSLSLLGTWQACYEARDSQDASTQSMSLLSKGKSQRTRKLDVLYHRSDQPDVDQSLRPRGMHHRHHTRAASGVQRRRTCPSIAVARALERQVNIDQTEMQA